MTFGFATLVDALSWAVALLLGAKVVATVILLSRRRDTWFDTRWGAGLWWTSKITPVLAVPALIAISLIEQDNDLLWLSLAMMLFVAVMVPVKIWRRFYRKPGGSRLPAG